ncbi:MAG: GNAT family N-acetyltransferase [Candidatus Theseobacter exili]|nr:GNAT family N-acetyltransferase [Candidatus Theseobacter exili]
MINSVDRQIELKIYKGQSGLDKIEDVWEKLYGSIENKRLWHLYKLYECYVSTMEDNPEEMYFFVFFKNLEAEAIIPLKRTIRKTLGFKTSVFVMPGYPDIPYRDFIITKSAHSEMFLQILLLELNKHSELSWDYICLPNVFEDSNAVISLKSFFSKNISVFGKKVDHCNYIKLKAGENIIEKLSRKNREELKRKRRRLSDLGEVTISTAASFPELNEAYLQLLDVESSGWKGDAGTSIKMNNKLDSFYRCLMNSFSESDDCEIHVIKYEGKSIAAQFVIKVRDVCYTLKIGYDENFRKVSPGILLKDYIIQLYQNRQVINYINFCSGESHNEIWRPLHKDLYDFFLFNKTMNGKAAQMLIRTKYYMRPLYRNRIKPLLKSVFGRKYRDLRKLLGLSRI